MNTKQKVQPTNAELRLRKGNAVSSATSSILTIALLSLLNIILHLTSANFYFPFCAMLPLAICDYAMYYCGKYPEEIYPPEVYAEAEFFGNGVFYALIVVAIFCIAAYFVCWLLARKFGIAWNFVALGMFTFDTLFMFLWYGLDISFLIDYILHIIVIVLFIVGIVSHFKLKKLPAVQTVAQNASDVTFASPIPSEPSASDAPSEAHVETESVEASAEGETPEVDASPESAETETAENEVR